MWELGGTSLKMPVTVKGLFTSNVMILPMGSSSPNISRALDSDRTMELGLLSAVAAFPLINGKENKLKMEGSANNNPFSRYTLSPYFKMVWSAIQGAIRT